MKNKLRKQIWFWIKEFPKKNCVFIWHFLCHSNLFGWRRLTIVSIHKNCFKKNTLQMCAVWAEARFVCLLLKSITMSYLVSNSFIGSLGLGGVVRMNNVFCVTWISSTIVCCHFLSFNFFDQLIWINNLTKLVFITKIRIIQPITSTK